LSGEKDVSGGAQAESAQKNVAPSRTDTPAGGVHEAIRDRLRLGPCFFTDFLVEFSGVRTQDLQERSGPGLGGRGHHDAFAPLRSARLAPPHVPERPRSPASA